MATKQYKINKPLPGFKVGDVANVEVDDDGVAIDMLWSRRIRDAATDNCIEEVVAAPSSKSSTKTSE